MHFSILKSENMNAMGSQMYLEKIQIFINFEKYGLKYTDFIENNFQPIHLYNYSNNEDDTIFVLQNTPYIFYKDNIEDRATYFEFKVIKLFDMNIQKVIYYLNKLLLISYKKTTNLGKQVEYTSVINIYSSRSDSDETNSIALRGKNGIFKQKNLRKYDGKIWNILNVLNDCIYTVKDQEEILDEDDKETCIFFTTRGKLKSQSVQGSSNQNLHFEVDRGTEFVVFKFSSEVEEIQKIKSISQKMLGYQDRSEEDFPERISKQFNTYGINIYINRETMEELIEFTIDENRFNKIVFSSL